MACNPHRARPQTHDNHLNKLKIESGFRPAALFGTPGVPKDLYKEKIMNYKGQLAGTSPVRPQL